MNVAIFYDAEAVAGDPDLLAQTKSELIDVMSGEPVLLAHFARAADSVSLADRPVQQSRHVDGSRATRSISRRAAFFRSCTACARSRSSTG